VREEKTQGRGGGRLMPAMVRGARALPFSFLAPHTRTLLCYDE
jgi:hypothetical protein